VPYQQCPIRRLLAQIDDKRLERHGLIVDADEQVAELRQEELELRVRKPAQLGTQHIVDTDVVGIASTGWVSE